jgi:hypothetical protein
VHMLKLSDCHVMPEGIGMWNPVLLESTQALIVEGIPERGLGVE